MVSITADNPLVVCLGNVPTTLKYLLFTFWSFYSEERDLGYWTDFSPLRALTPGSVRAERVREN